MSRKLLSLGLGVACGVASLTLGFACSSSEVPVVQDADGSTGGRSGSDAETLPDTTFDACRNYPPPPTSTIYKCEAGAPGTKGCFGTDPPTSTIYPLGCQIVRPIQGPGCGGLGCYCTDQFGPGDAGGTWICPD